MTHDELNEARSNPEFLDYLETTRVDAIKTKNISALYEVLDSFLILDLDEEKINHVYENILKISFENVERIVNSGDKLSLEDDELFYIRSFYEHAIEKWSYENLQGAKELLFVLLNIISDEKLQDAIKVLVIALYNNIDLDSFYEKEVDQTFLNEEDKYGYFIMNFTFDEKEYIQNNEEILHSEYEKLKHLLA